MQNALWTFVLDLISKVGGEGVRYRRGGVIAEGRAPLARGDGDAEQANGPCRRGRTVDVRGRQIGQLCGSAEGADPHHQDRPQAVRADVQAARNARAQRAAEGSLRRNDPAKRLS